MDIYPSKKGLPYVYYGLNKETGQFYYGYRERNVYYNLSSSDDLGKLYFTSSRKVKQNFSQFEWTILAEFFDKESAYWFEQELISENWSNPLLINKHFSRPGSHAFKNNGHSEKTKKKLSIILSGEGNGHYGKKHSPETLQKMSDKKKGTNNPSYQRPVSQETKEKLRQASTGAKFSEERKSKLSEKAKQRKLLDCTICGKSCPPGQLARWHNLNCKHRIT